MVFKKSTRAIVTGKRPVNASGQTPEGEVPAEGTAGGNGWMAKLSSLPRWVLPAGICLLAVIVLIVILAAVLGGGEKAPAVPVAAEGQVIAAVEADAAVAAQALPGDVARIYGTDGAPVPELQYVQISGTADGALLVLLDDAQTAALVQQERVKVALAIHNDPEQAAVVLDLQKRINDPQISLTVQKDVSMAPGDTLALTFRAQISPVEAVLPEAVWESGDPDVATVENGTVTAQGIGETVIRVTCGDAEAQCRVTVIDLALDTTELTLGVGETHQLTATAGDFPVTWRSADPQIAEVAEDGTVTGIAPGTTQISALCRGVEVTCQVTIGYRAEVAQLDNQLLTLTVGSTAVLTPTVYPGTDVIDAASFETSDPAILTVAEDGTVTAVAEGTATVTYRCGAAAASCTVKVEKP